MNAALKIRPGSLGALMNRAHLEYLLGDLDAAIADLDQALALNPDFAGAYLNRGIIKERQRDRIAALADLRHYRQLVPRDPNADYALLWIWVIRREQNEMAEADQELSSPDAGWNAAPGDWASQNRRFLLGQIDERYFCGCSLRGRRRHRSKSTRRSVVLCRHEAPSCGR